VCSGGGGGGGGWWGSVGLVETNSLEVELGRNSQAWKTFQIIRMEKYIFKNPLKAFRTKYRCGIFTDKVLMF